MEDKSAASHPAPRASHHHFERNTLQSIDQIFLHDQLEALLASPTLARVAARREERADPKVEDSTFDRDTEACRETEPSVDAQLLRDALRRGLK